MTWQPKTVWTKTFIVFYRDVPTSDGRIISRNTKVSRARLPVPVICRTLEPSWHGGLRCIGKVTFLNESDDGCFWATVEMDYDPATLPPGLYPEVDFGPKPIHDEDCFTCMREAAKIFTPLDGLAVSEPEIEFISMHLGVRPAWPDLDPVT